MNLDRRLLALAREHRLSLGITLAAGFMGGILIIVQARELSRVISRVFLESEGLAQVMGPLRVLLLMIVARSALAWLSEVSAKRLAVSIKHDLRRELFAQLCRLGPCYTRGERTGELTAVAEEGVEALDAYFSQYLPQLALAAFIPLSVLVFVFPLDPLSGVIFLLTAPLIPLFMVLIGKAAEARTSQRYSTLRRLSAHFLDSLQGLTTLKLFGQSKAHQHRIEAASDEYREVTMSVLRVTFLSALVLEMVATLSTAVIAVQIGLRLLYGGIGFEKALFLILLAPDFYLPLRTLGARFHAGMSGSTAARRIFSVLATESRQPIVAAEPLRRLNGFSAITFTDVGFTYPGETSPVLRGITFSLAAGEHLALVGASGAGKSTLVDLLLRFREPSAGTIQADDRDLRSIAPETWRSLISWVPQKPFIFNASLADNIRLGRPNADRDQVIQAAKDAYLHEFISSLPAGYDTQVGERGERLSAGQAQRLALARAFLLDAPLLILDETTSNLDPGTEARIQVSTSRLKQDRTVITIAHRLNTVYEADRILVLDQGRIAETGSHHELSPAGGVYASLLRGHVLRDQAPSPSGHPLSPATVEARKPESAAVDPIFPMPTLLPLRLLRFLKGSWGRVALSTTLGAATVASGIGLVGTSSWLISAAALRPPLAELGIAIVGVRTFGISRGIFRYLERLSSHDVTFRLLARIRSGFFAAVEPLAPARLSRFRGGDLLSRAVADVESLEDFYVRVVSPTIVATVIPLASALFLARFEARLGATLLVFAFATGLGLPALIGVLSRRPGQDLVEARAHLRAELVDGIQGLADLLAYGRAHAQQAAIEAISHEYGHWQRRMGWIMGLQSALTTALSQFGMLSVLALAIRSVESGAVPGLMLAALTTIALASFEAVVPLPSVAQRLGELSHAARRVFDVVDAKAPVDEGSAGRLTSPAGEIRFSRVTFAYRSDEPPALTDFSFHLEQGRTLAIVGASGSGKTTVLNLLLRFWRHQRGEISLGGRPIEVFALEAVRAMIAVVPQRPHFFNATIEENLRLARPAASYANLDRALELAQIDDFVRSLPQGLETPVGEGGLRLSGGERQRMAFARALLKGAPVLALDEPTADLDPINEAGILKVIFEGLGAETAAGEPRTTLLITHRLIGLENVDQILVLSRGRIAEQGTHGQLARSEGPYARMLEVQNRMPSGHLQSIR